MAKAIFKYAIKRKFAEYFWNQPPPALLAPSREGGWGDPHQRERPPISLKTRALTFLTPTTAKAEVCDKVRPKWDPASGPATTLSETIFLLSSPIGLAICGVFLLAVLTRKIGWIVGSIATTGGGAILFYLRDQLETEDAVTQFAIQEGCVGPTTLTVAICLGFCFISAGLLLMKRKTGDEHA